MKNIILFVTFFYATFSHGNGIEKRFEVVLRSEENKAVTGVVGLKDISSDESFDGTYFKIVKGKESDAIRFDADKELVFRAATAYYHLSKAREYFVNIAKSDYVKNLPKMVIRIQHTNEFSELGHFAHDNKDPQYNNALTIPAGTGLASRGVKPWGMEIWFRPSKKIHLRDLKVNDLGQREVKGLMSSFRNQIHMQSLQSFLATSVMAMTVDNYEVGVDSVMRTVGSSLIIEVGYRFIDPITKLFSRKWYWLDSALVPEIIYHEYAHAALSDKLVLSHSTAVIEGMADFFAGQIADSPYLATKIKRYNTYNGKNATKKQDYVIQFESTDYANTDFVFGLLWDMKKIIGEDMSTEFMYDLRTNITTNSSIRNQLIEGLLFTCEKKCKAPFIDKLKILKSLNMRGI